MIEILDLPTNRAVNLLRLPLDLHRLDSTLTLSGEATVGLRSLGHVAGVDIGLWQMSPSVSTDVEVDEAFVVLVGEATVHFADKGQEPLELRPGTLVHLAAGTRTVWDVRQTLRKLYLLPADTRSEV